MSKQESREQSRRNFLKSLGKAGLIGTMLSYSGCDNDKSAGPFEKSQYRPDKAAGNFINELFTCDFLPLVTPNDLRSTCLRKL